MHKRKILVILLNIIAFSVIGLKNVSAAACTLEQQVKVNNEAGLVSYSVQPFEYHYSNPDVSAENKDSDETQISGYLGMLEIYNLTDNIYVTVADSNENSQTKYTYNDSADGTVSLSTGSMEYLKNYTISIFASNEDCSKNAIRTIDVVVPRENRYYYSDYCENYPDYFYCSQFLNLEEISQDDFNRGIKEYAKTHKSATNDNRKEGIIEVTADFAKNNWLIIAIVIIVILGIIAGAIVIKNKKRKKQIV